MVGDIEVPVPEGMYPPFAVITKSDHGGLIIIASALGLSLVLMFSSIRTFVRCATNRHGPGIDDAFLAAATVSDSIGRIQQTLRALRRSSS